MLIEACILSCCMHFGSELYKKIRSRNKFKDESSMQKDLLETQNSNKSLSVKNDNIEYEKIVNSI